MKNGTSLSLFSLALLGSVSWSGLAVAATLTVTDIATSSAEGFELRVSSVEAVDANIDEAGIRALFSRPFPDSATTLAVLDAAAIRVPEMTIIYEGPGEDGQPVRSEITYRDLELLNVREGVAASARIDSTEIATSGSAGATVTLGTISTDLLNIGGILGFYGLTPDRSDEIRPIYENFAIEGGTVTSEAVTCTLGRASAERFSARPLDGTFTELMNVTAELAAAENDDTPPSPEAIAAIVDFYADFLTALESSPAIIEGFSCEGSDTDDKKLSFSVGPATVGGFAPGIYPEISLKDIAVEAEDGSFHIGSFIWKSMDMRAPLDKLASADGAFDEAWFSTNWRELIPGIEGFSIADLVIDVPAAEPDEPRVQGEIASIDVSLDDYVNGIPSTIDSSGSGMVFPLPPTEDAAVLRALGFETLSVGYGIKAHWNRDEQTIAIDRLSFSGDQLGTITLSGTLANAGEELFSSREEVAAAAALTLTATELTVEIENAGGLPLLIAAAAAEEKQEPESFHVAIAGMAQALPLALLGGTPEALELSTALGAFMNGTPALRVTLTAVDPRGIGLPELLAAQEDPGVLRGKFTIAAEAAGEPVPLVWPDLPSSNLEKPADNADRSGDTESAATDG